MKYQRRVIVDSDLAVNDLGELWIIDLGAAPGRRFRNPFRDSRPRASGKEREKIVGGDLRVPDGQRVEVAKFVNPVAIGAYARNADVVGSTLGESVFANRENE